MRFSGPIKFATSNPNKVREAQRLAEGAVEFTEIPESALTPEVEETGETFMQNAVLKAEGYSGRVEGPVISEDSGLVVDALNGWPGVKSARIADTAEARNQLVLERLAERGCDEPERRRCRYVAAVALAERGETRGMFVSKCEGRILPEERGDGGFGYDPIFYSMDLEQSFGLADPEAKNEVSHRGRALKLLINYLTPRLAGERASAE